MRLAAGALVVLVGGSAALIGHGQAGEPILAAASGIDDLLSGVDYVPDRVDLDDALGDPPEDQLIAIATSEDTDPGVRIRAYRALAHYPTDPTRVVLITTITTLQGATSGVDVLYLRAAMHSLAAVAGQEAVMVLEDLLDSASRDVRADAALALGETGAPDADPVLRARREIETVEQVKWAIDEALASLAAN